jgi:tetratricopeptide (TPR) repeat protein
MGNTQGAIDAYQRALAARPDKRTEAALKMLQGDANAAVAAFAEAEKESPVDADAMQNDFAAALAKLGRDQEALEHYEEALKLNPNLYDAQMNIGALLSRMDRNDEALSHFQAAAKANPKLAEPHVYIALVEAQRGELASAINEATAALSLDPDKANRHFTNAIHMPYKDSNLHDWIEFLKTQQRR